jgi:hypothetical protein
MSRVEESRARLRARVVEIEREVEQQKERALAWKDAAVAIVGAVGAFLAVRQLTKALGRGRAAERGGKAPRAPQVAKGAAPNRRPTRRPDA